MAPQTGERGQHGVAVQVGPAKGSFGTCWGWGRPGGAGRQEHKEQAGIRIRRFRGQVGHLGKALAGEGRVHRGGQKAGGDDAQWMQGRPWKGGTECRALAGAPGQFVF